MSTAAGALSWLLLAAAVLTAPPRLAARHVARTPRPPRTAGRGGRAATAAAVTAVGLACVLVGGPVGAGVAAVGGPALWWGLERLRRRPVPPLDDPALPVTLDLVAAVLRGGRPLADAVRRAAPAAGAGARADLERVAGLLRLGADPALAWAAVRPDGPLADVVPVAVRSAASGMRVAAAFEDLADDLRGRRRAAGAMRAQRAGVRAMGPLAACFLPSFVCLGIIPVVVGIAANALDVLP